MRRKTKDPIVPTEVDFDKLADRAVDKAMRKIDEKLMTKINGPKVSSIEIQNTASRDEIRTLMNEQLYWYNHAPCKTDEEVAERLNEFFARVQETGEIATMEKLSLALGITDATFNRWMHGELGMTRRDMCKKACQIIKAQDASLVAHRKIPEVTYIFRAKNYYDMNDKREIEISADSPYAESTPEELRKRYLESVGAINADGTVI